MTTERPGVGEARIGRQERGGRTPPAEHSSAAPFGDRLCDAIERMGTPACVGLDPVLERLPVAATDAKGKPIGAADRIEAFCAGVIEAVAGVVPIVKPQSACFERFGQAGVGVLKRTIQLARQRGLIVILDAKRGDIGTTAEHYAAAAFGAGSSANAAPGAAARSGLDADAITLSGYMGMETVEPFLSAGGLGGGQPVGADDGQRRLPRLGGELRGRLAGGDGRTGTLDVGEGGGQRPAAAAAPTSAP